MPEVYDISVHSTHADVSIVSGKIFSRDESRPDELEPESRAIAQDSNNERQGEALTDNPRYQDVETERSQSELAVGSSLDHAPSGSGGANGKAQAQSDDQSCLWQPVQNYFGRYGLIMPFKKFTIIARIFPISAMVF